MEELNDLAMEYEMPYSNHSSSAGSMASLDTEMNINGSTKMLNTCPASLPYLEIDEECINLLSLNNHKVGVNAHRQKNYMRILPTTPPKFVDEHESCDKLLLIDMSK